MTTLRVAGLVQGSVVDEPGLRCAVFVQGCSHRCAGCHNPGIWDPTGEREVPVGRAVDVLADGPYLESRRTLSVPWRGSSNQRQVDPVTGIPCSDPLPEEQPRATLERPR